MKVTNGRVTYKEFLLYHDIILNEIYPCAKENKFSLHETFEFYRNHDAVKYDVLRKYWRTKHGKMFLRSLFRTPNRLKGSDLKCLRLSI